MEKNSAFNLQERIGHWISQIEIEPSVIKLDTEGLKGYLLEEIDQLKLDAGLDDEEAFFIATRRWSKKIGLKKDPQEINNELLTIGGSLIILGGVLVYYLVYFLIQSTSKMLLSGLLYLNVDDLIAIGWYNRYLLTSELIVLLFFIRIYFFEKKTIEFVEKIRFSPKSTIFFLVVTIFLGAVDTSFLPIIKWVISHDLAIRNQLGQAALNFNYSFPLLVCLSFVVLFVKYYKKVSYLGSST